MTRLVLFLALTLFGASASAQGVKVRSGEHTDFSRLVVGLADDLTWEITSLADGYLLQWSRPYALDLTGVFTRISRERLSRVEARGDALFLEVGCDCHIDASEYTGDRLVIDIKDGTGPDRVENPATTAQNDDLAPTASVLPVILPPHLDRAKWLPPMVPVLTITPDKNAGDTDEPDTRVSSARSTLLESLSRGTAQGLLSPAAISATRTQTAPGRVARSTIDPHPPLRIAANLLGPLLTSQTGMDRDAPPNLRIATSKEDPLCVRNDRVDVAAWAKTASYFDGISDLRRRLYDPRDRLQPEVLEDLIRFQIHFGFGAEALLLMRSDSPPRDAALLQTLARLVDGLPVDPFVLAGQHDCHGDIALWATLAGGSGAAPDRRSVVLAFSALPPGLKTQLGPRLSQRLRELGARGSAQDILRFAARELGTPTPAQNLEEARIAASLDDTRTAETRLRPLVDGSQPVVPDALADLIELETERGDPLGEDTVTLADAIAFESEGTAVGDRIERALIAAHIAADEFGAATARLAALPPTSPFINQDRSALGRAVADRAADVEFLRYAVVTPPDLLHPPVQNAIASRLIEIGLPDLARPWLSADVTRDDAAERRYLRATVAALGGDLRGVETLLSGLTDPRAMNLRQKAAVVRGDARAALSAVSTGTLPGVDLTWRAASWDRLATQDQDQLLQDTGVAMVDLLAEPRPPLEDETEAVARPPSQGPIARSRVLIEASQSSRTLIAALLNRFPAPETDQ